jgi:cysteine desulfurase
MYGGDQEKGIRPGTLPVPLIVGFAKALELTVQNRDKESLRLQKLQTYFFERLKKEIPQIEINGSITERIPNNVHIALPHFDSELVLLELDAKGIAASAKSACKSHDPLASYVIMNVRKDLDAVTLENTAFIRFSMGRTTTQKDIDYVVATLQQIVEKYSRFNS